MKLRIRPKDNFSQEANYQQLYALTEHWQSDLEFYKDELRFLHKLLDKYFIWIVNDQNLVRVQKLVEKLHKLEKEQQELSDEAKSNFHMLVELIDNEFTADEDGFREKHEDLEEDFADFVSAFREFRKEVFEVTEEIIESEKLKHLLAKP